jgi:competence protein ComEC
VTALGTVVRPYALTVAAGCVLVGVVDLGLRMAALHAGPWARWVDRGVSVTLTGTVVADPTLRAGAAWSGAGPSSGVVIRVTRGSDRTSDWQLRAPVLLLGEGAEWLRLHPGQSLSVQGRVEAAPPQSPLAAVVFARGPPQDVTAAAPWWRVAERFRVGLREAASSLGPDAAGLLPALVVGDTSAMPQDLTADLRASGLAHLTAVSGANVTIIVVAVLLSARSAGLRGRWLPLLGLLTVLAFVLVARPQPSVLRAVVMGGLGVVGVLVAGRRIGLQALLAAVLLLLLADPWLARSWGFGLSVAATGGLLTLAPHWRDSWARHLPRPVAEGLAVTVAAQVVTLPLQVSLAGTISWAAVPANVVAGVAVAPATVLGASAAGLSWFSAPAAHWVAWLAGWPVAWIATVARHGAAAPLPDIRGPTGAAGLLVGLCLAVLLLAAVPLTRRMFVRLGPLPRLAAMFVALGLVAAWWLGQGRWPPPGWVLVACDVGQGDALVLPAGHASAVVVDTGPEPGAVDRCLRRLGVSHVIAVVLTHDHADHVGGLPGVLRGRRVDAIFVTPLDDPAEGAAAVRSEASAGGVPVEPLVAGQRATAGSVAWQVVWPAELIRGQGSDANNASIVLLVELSGIRLLLTGDVEAPAQVAMLAWADAHGVDLHAEVLKVPHHGSANQDPELWAAVDPRVAVVSGGAGNPYGHPDDTTIAELEARGILVERTDLDGDLAVVVDGGVRVLDR